MYPLSEWARPHGSFNVPLPVPISAPNADPLVEVHFNSEWLPYILGALLQLGEQSTWATADRDELILVREWVWELLNQFGNWQDFTGDAPYWDDADGDDATGNEPPPEDFPFLENAADFVVTTFLAASFTPGAAIQFVTIARKFRLLFRSRDYGGIVKVFLDDVLQGTVDTYSADPGIASIDIFTPAATGFTAFDVDEWRLRVELTDEANPEAVPVDGFYGMEAIRKRLFTAEVSPDDLRYDETTDEVQQTYDGGDTWVDNPGQDPRHAPQFRFPVIDAGDPRCQAAANSAAWLENFIEETLNILAAGSTVAGLVTLMVTLFLTLGPWAIVVGVLLPIAFLIFDAGVTAISAAFTVEAFDILECIIYCHMDENGQVDAAALALINSDIDAQIGGLAATVLHAIFLASGEVGLSNAGTLGEAPADCDECGCEWCHEFTGSDYLTVWSASGNGTHSAQGYTNTSPLHLTHIEFDWLITGAGTGGDSAAAIFSQNNFTSRIALEVLLGSSGTIVWDGDLTGSTGVSIFCNDNGAVGATISITRVLERGIGPAPYSQNCE